MGVDFILNEKWGPEPDNIKKINSRHIPELQKHGIEVPENACFATFFNRTREIN